MIYRWNSRKIRYFICFKKFQKFLSRIDLFVTIIDAPEKIWVFKIENHKNNLNQV